MHKTRPLFARLIDGPIEDFQLPSGEAYPLEPGRGSRAESWRRPPSRALLFCSLAHNLSRLRLETTPIACGTRPKAFLNLVIQVADDQLCHGRSTVMISLRSSDIIDLLEPQGLTPCPTPSPVPPTSSRSAR